MTQCKAMFCTAEDHGDDPNTHCDVTGHIWWEDVSKYKGEVIARSYEWKDKNDD